MDRQDTKRYLHLNEAKMKYIFLKQIMESLDYAIQIFNLSKEDVNLIEEIKYKSDFGLPKRDLEFKEERKEADIMVARKYLHDRKYQMLKHSLRDS